MIERYAFFKLKDEFSSPEAIAEVARALRDCLGNLIMVTAFWIAEPADEPSRTAWDLALRVRFAGPAELAAYQSDPSHKALLDEVLLPRVLVRKAWNFSVQGA